MMDGPQNLCSKGVGECFFSCWLWVVGIVVR